MDKKSIASHDGKDGSPSYIVYDKKIYDVTASKLWQDGTHMNRHKAGADLSEFMSMAPHGPEVLKRFPMIGAMASEIEKPDSAERYRRLYNKYHPHPVLLHYPMGVLPFGALLLALYLLTGYQNFEPASYYALIFGTICLFPVIGAGILSWCINYQRMFTRIFTIKLSLSVVVLILCTAAVFLRPLFPEIDRGLLSIIYCLCYFVTIPCLFSIAYNGGKITWPA